MTILHTPIYGIASIDRDTPLEDLAVASQEVAATLEAALKLGGIAPPAAQDLAALSARVTAAEELRWRVFRTRWGAATYTYAGGDVALTGFTATQWDAGAAGSADEMKGAAATPGYARIRKTGRYDIDCTLAMLGGTVGSSLVLRLTTAGTVASSFANSAGVVSNENAPRVQARDVLLTAGQTVIPLMWCAATAGLTVRPELNGQFSQLDINYRGPAHTNPTSRSFP